MPVIGSYRYSLDDKHRVRLPQRSNETLGATPVMSAGVGGRVNIMSFEMFLKQHPQFENPDLYNEEKQDVSTELFDKVFWLEPDSQGRVVIPQKIIDFFGIENEVVFVGKLSYIEMWPAKDYDAREELINKNNLSVMLKKLSEELNA